MKITDMKAYLLKGHFQSTWPAIDRMVNPLDYYDEYLGKPNVFGQSVHMKPAADLLEVSKIMLEITTDEGISGIHIPVEQFMQVEIALKTYKPYLIGKDPMATRMIWDIMDRGNNRGRAGIDMTAVAAIDNALWDLKGKITNQPVYKLLGGGREKLKAYISMLGCDVDDMDKVREWALKARDMNVYGQKWFFKYGPSSGSFGIDKNLELAYTLRELLGKNYNLMFDAWAGWDLSYCIEMFKKLEPVRPLWIEEPLRVDRIEAFRVLRSKSDLQISCGERLYNRFEIHQFLKEGLIDFYQPEPEICGGITEVMRIGELCELYGVKFAPHGLSLMPNLSISAAMPPDITPCLEYLECTIPGHICLLKNPPGIVDGFVHLPQTPGLFELDEEKVLSKEEIVL